MPVNQVSWSPISFVIKDPLQKLKAKKSKFYFHNFLGNIVVNIHAKYRKAQMKTEGAYFIWKKVDWRMDGHGRTDRLMDDIGSASDKLRWLCQQWS